MLSRIFIPSQARIPRNVLSIPVQFLKSITKKGWKSFIEASMKRLKVLAFRKVALPCIKINTDSLVEFTKKVGFSEALITND